MLSHQRQSKIAGSTQIFNSYHSSFSFKLTQGLLISFQYSCQTHDNPSIQSQILLHSDAPLCDAGAWVIIQSFAKTDTTLSEIENMLRDHLWQCYNFNDWKPAFDVVCSDASVNLHPPPLNDL